MKRALIHYFSGTSNTYHMVKVIGDRIKQHYQVSFIANIFLYGVLFLAMTFFTDIIMNALERISIIRKLFEYSYTRKYRRYMVKEFKKYLIRN